MKISEQICKEVEREVCDGTSAEGKSWFSNTFARILMESPELAITLAKMGMPSMTGGALVYDAMERQIRKDALAAAEKQG